MKQLTEQQITSNWDKLRGIINDTFTGSNSLLTLTADISGGNVRLRASGNEPNTAVNMYRVLLSDAESSASSDNTKTVGQVSVSSSATAIDTFQDTSQTVKQKEVSKRVHIQVISVLIGLL